MKRRQPITFLRFVEQVIGAKLRPAQRVYVAVAFDGVEPRDLPRGERRIARELFGAVRKVPDSARGVVAAVLGARSGKSWLAALYLLWRAVTADLSTLAPGERAVALAIAPDIRLARLVVRFALGAARSVPSLSRLVVAEGADRVVLRRPDGCEVTIEAIPAGHGHGGAALRGRSLVGAVLDECAFFRSDDQSHEVTDGVVFAAVAPRVMPGGLVVLQSTPWTEQGLLHQLWRDESGKPRTALVAHGPTALMRRGDRHVEKMLARERTRDPKNAAREYDAQFMAAETSALTRDDIARCVDDIAQRAPASTDDNAHAVGLDVGLRRDATAIVVAHRECRSRADGGPPDDLVVVDHVHTLKPGLIRKRHVQIEDVIHAVRRVHASYPGLVLHDLHYSSAVAPPLQAAGVRTREVSMAPRAQAQRIELFLSLLAAGRLRLVNHPDLLRELQQARLKRHAGGRVTLEAPRRAGAHDDVLDALLLAVEHAATLVPTGGDIFAEQAMHGHWSPETGLTGFGRRWFRRTPDGAAVPCDPPPGTPEWRHHVRERLALGEMTPAIDRWLRDEAQIRGEDPSAAVTRALQNPNVVVTHH